MKFKCNGCGSERTIYKTTTVLKNEEWVVKEAKCSCEEDIYMEEILTDEHKGFPGLIRTEPTHRKKK
jgi:hypothetical protein